MAEAATSHAERVLAVLREPTNESPVAQSWRRCLLNHRLDPERVEQPVVVSEIELRRPDHAGRLLRSADLNSTTCTAWSAAWATMS